MEHCEENKINPKCWKRSLEARTHKLRDMINADCEHNDCMEASRGEETTPREYEDDVDSETEDLKKKLRSFKKSGLWSESDDECFSSNDDESDDSSSAEAIAIVMGKKSEMKQANEKDEDED